MAKNKKELSGIALKLKLQKKAIKYLQEKYDKRKALANSDLWSPEEQIYNELKHFDGKDIMPNRDVPSPEEGILNEIKEQGITSQDPSLQKHYMGPIDDIAQYSARNNPKTEKAILRQSEEARNLAIKAFGSPDNTIWEFQDGEVGEMTQQEKGYLEESKDDKERKKRENVVRSIGSGEKNPKTGRKKYIIPLAVAAGAMIIGGAAKMIGGHSKRKAQRSAMRAEQKEMQENIDQTKTDFTGAKKMAGQEFQAQQTMDSITQRGTFDAFVADAAKSVVPEGDYVKKQKGLQTGVGAEANAVVDESMSSTANTQSEIQIATANQQTANNSRAMDEMQTSSDRILESLKRGKNQIGKQIAGTKGMLNVFTDALGGASQGLSTAASLYGGGIKGVGS